MAALAGFWRPAPYTLDMRYTMALLAFTALVSGFIAPVWAEEAAKKDDEAAKKDDTEDCIRSKTTGECVKWKDLNEAAKFGPDGKVIEKVIGSPVPGLEEFLDENGQPKELSTEKVAELAKQYGFNPDTGALVDGAKANPYLNGSIPPDTADDPYSAMYDPNALTPATSSVSPYSSGQSGSQASAPSSPQILGGDNNGAGAAPPSAPASTEVAPATSEPTWWEKYGPGGCGFQCERVPVTSSEAAGTPTAAAASPGNSQAVTPPAATPGSGGPLPPDQARGGNKVPASPSSAADEYYASLYNPQSSAMYSSGDKALNPKTALDPKSLASTLTDRSDSLLERADKSLFSPQPISKNAAPLTTSSADKQDVFGPGSGLAGTFKSPEAGSDTGLLVPKNQSRAPTPERPEVNDKDRQVPPQNTNRTTKADLGGGNSQTNAAMQAMMGVLQGMHMGGMGGGMGGLGGLGGLGGGGVGSGMGATTQTCTTTTNGITNCTTTTSTNPSGNCYVINNTYMCKSSQAAPGCVYGYDNVSIMCPSTTSTPGVTPATTVAATALYKAGYLDGSNGSDVDSKYKTDANYLSGYIEGQKYRQSTAATSGSSSSGSSSTSGKTPTETDTFPYDKVNTVVMTSCTSGFAAMADAYNVNVSLLPIVFKDSGSFTDADTQLLVEPANQTAVGKIRASFIEGMKARAVGTTPSNPRWSDAAYREGFSCAGKVF